MKKMHSLIIAVGLVAASVSSAYAACAQPIFTAKTANHKKAVEICMVGNQVSYEFGKVGEKPELSLLVPANQTIYGWRSSSMVNLTSFGVKNGDITYYINDGEAEGNGRTATLGVFKGKDDKQLASIDLDVKTIVNNISPALEESGVQPE